jgi:hypothetical protein
VVVAAVEQAQTAFLITDTTPMEALAMEAGVNMVAVQATLIALAAMVQFV